jgi:uncharacterized protein
VRKLIEKLCGPTGLKVCCKPGPTGYASQLQKTGAMTTFSMHMSQLSRRAFLVGTGALLGGAVVDAFAIEPNWLERTRHDVPIEKIPWGLDGFSVMQVTDVHLKHLGKVEEAIVRTVQTENIQLVVLTGDIVDSAQSLPMLKELCAAMRKPGVTVLAALGNWEHWGRIPLSTLENAYKAVGIKLLVNEEVVHPEGIRVFATDDSTGGGPRIRDLGDSKDPPTLFVTHSPEFLDRKIFDEHTFAFALCGHTHGGQVRLGPRAIPFMPAGCGRFVSGWYDTPAGRAYVSRGIGTSILPARFTCRPELPIFRLRQA